MATPTIGDSVGWPTVEECLKHIEGSAPDGLTPAVAQDVPYLLEAVKAHFQSPVGEDRQGGTGRNFTPGLPEVRIYDGNGFPELIVDDIVPGTLTKVTVFDTTLADVLLKDPGYRGLGWNVLYRPQSSGAILGTSYGLSGLFPMGKQNVKVYATFAFAARVPVDVWQAIRGEVFFQALSQGAVGIDGVGQRIKMGPFELDTAAGTANWEKSSPMAINHKIYENAVKRYRLSGARRRMQMKQRMS